MTASAVAERIPRHRTFKQPMPPAILSRLARRRVAECLAMTMIGDGFLAMVEPVRHEQLWHEGPKWWRTMLQPFAGRPSLVRCIGAAEFAFGFWLASKQKP